MPNESKLYTKATHDYIHADAIRMTEWLSRRIFESGCAGSIPAFSIPSFCSKAWVVPIIKKHKRTDFLSAALVWADLEWL